MASSSRHQSKYCSKHSAFPQSGRQIPGDLTDTNVFATFDCRKRSGQGKPRAAMPPTEYRSMRRLLPTLVALLAVAVRAQEEVTPTPTPITDFPPAAGSGSDGGSPATVAPVIVDNDAENNSSNSGSMSSSSSSYDPTPEGTTPPPVAPKTIRFALVHSPSSNEAVDLLEIVQLNLVDTPRISFESMTDRTNWGVDKWENPLNMLANMIANERIEVANDNVPLDVQLNDPAIPSKVVFTKANSWQYGPTLVLKDDALAGLTNLQTLEFHNFNVSFEGAKWMPPSLSLNKLSFTNATVSSFSVPADAEIAEVVIRESTVEKFPAPLLSMKTLPSSFVVEASNFLYPLELTSTQVENLMTIAHVELAKNAFPPADEAQCDSVMDVYSQAICVKAASASTNTPSTRKPASTPSKPSRPSTPNTPTETETPSGEEQTDSIPSMDDVPDDISNDPNASNQSKSASNALISIIMAVVGVAAAVILVVGFIWVRRRKPGFDNDQPSPLTFTNHNDKFLDDPEADVAAPMGLDMSARSTTSVAACGIMNEVNLGARVITAETKLGVNGLWKADYRGETVVALRVDVEKLRERHLDIEPIVKSCMALQHPYVIDFVGTSSSLMDEMWLVVELMNNGSLWSLLQSPTIEISWEQIKKMSQRIASALAFVLSSRPASALFAPSFTSKSVLCDQRLNCKLDMFDFISGTRDFVSPSRTFGQGEIAYRAPELLDRTTSAVVSAAAASAAEVYALGVIFCELSHRSLLYRDILHDRGITMGEIFVARQVRAGKLFPTPAEDVPEEFASIISACVAFNPADRPTLTQIVEWLREC